MTGRVSLACLALALAIASPVAAQSVTQVTLLPATYYIGDAVEARVTVRGVALDDVVVPETLPDLEWVTMEEIVALSRPDGVEIRILFRPYFPGTRTLPPVDLGSFELSGLSVFVSSVLEEEARDLEPMRDQLLLPGTRLIVTILAAILVLLPVTIATTGGFARSLVERIRRGYRERMPFRRMSRQLKQLDARVHELDGRTYYIELLSLVRLYLQQRLGISILSSTTAELPRFLSAAGVPSEVRERIVEVFQFGDLVKFASRHAGIETRKAHLTEIRNAAVRIQKEPSIGVGPR